MVGGGSARPEAGVMSTVDVCRATGASYRQLDHWVRCGYIDAHDVAAVGSGHHRRWNPDQVSRVRALVQAAEIKSTPLGELADLLSHS